MNQHRLELKNAQEARERERELAKEITRDGEGATKLVEVVVEGAVDVASAATLFFVISPNSVLRASCASRIAPASSIARKVTARSDSARALAPTVPPVRSSSLPCVRLAGPAKRAPWRSTSSLGAKVDVSGMMDGVEGGFEACCEILTPRTATAYVGGWFSLLFLFSPRLRVSA